MIDKDGKLFGKLNIIDALIILVVILAIVVVANLGVIKAIFDPANKATEGDVFVTYYVGNVKDVSVSSVNEGDIFHDEKTKAYVGEVVAKDVSNRVIGVPTSSGEYVKSEVPDKFDMTFTLKVKGSWDDRNIYVNGEAIHIGETKQIISKRNNFITVIYGLETSEDKK